ncbi:MAG: FkbM family methyltransferase [Betaproteobacteria bacterium]|nr:MAG: FkbM family methyltransferase [Betaproteobacteria bacterium]
MSDASLHPQRVNIEETMRNLKGMVSYAQNFEDVLLRRVLHDVASGFYVDVGAQEPKIDSVTKHFYENGWRGINLEPHPEYFVALRNDRPRDINLNIAASDRVGTTEFYFVDNSGLSSADPRVKEVAGAHGLAARVGQVPTNRLAGILAEHGVDEIHFMKIDVEGAEAAVLRGMDFARWRPWVMLIEGTLPNNPAPCWDQFEPLAIAGGYKPVYFDGLNRWYLRNESIDREPLFSVPINVFDQFTRWKEHEWNLLQTTPRTAPIAMESFASAFRR